MTVKVSGAVAKSSPAGCWEPQVNWVSVSSFSAVYWRTEEVVESPVVESTSTEVVTTIPSNHVPNG